MDDINAVTRSDKLLFVGGVRVLRPTEFEKLCAVVVQKNKKEMLQACLVAGARFVEMQRIKEHSEWYDPITPCVRLPQSADKKHKRSQKGRTIRLNRIGSLIIDRYLHLDDKLPDLRTWNNNLKRWALKAGIGSEGMSAKTTRKTWECWLMQHYPEFVYQICLSQGHDTITSLHHYQGVVYTEIDLGEMLQYTEGWKPRSLHD